MKAFAPAYLKTFYATTLSTYLLMGPMLWFYTQWLTAERPWSWQRKDWLHLLPAALAAVAIIIRVTFDLDTQKPTFADLSLPVAILAAFAGVVSFVLLATWPFQSAYYVYRIIRRLAAYRSQLKNIFASDEDRKLGWLTVLTGGFAILWLAVFATILKENVFGATFNIPKVVAALLFLILVWSLGLWGLNQRPGFEGHYIDDPDPAAQPSLKAPKPDQKYQRSALGEDQAQRIAGKIEAAMERDALYLEPLLSLNRLASHISVTPNYISQTLNETIGECFFDYVNKWRIKAALPRIISGEDTILAIALDVGFNARSSFYKAFKRELGVTPSEYRRAQTESAERTAKTS